MNRYERVKVARDPDEGRLVLGFRLAPAVDVDRTFQVYANDGDTFESMAFVYYGSSKLWWVIADQNPLIHPLFLVAGDRVRILKREHLPFNRLQGRF